MSDEPKSPIPDPADAPQPETKASADHPDHLKDVKESPPVPEHIQGKTRSGTEEMHEFARKQIRQAQEENRALREKSAAEAKKAAEQKKVAEQKKAEERKKEESAK